MLDRNGDLFCNSYWDVVVESMTEQFNKKLLAFAEPAETEFCDYCNDVHEMLDFGKDFSGKQTIVCSNKLSDALVKTMPKPDYGELESEVIQ